MSTNKITYTRGTIEKIDSEYYTLVLYKSDKEVYKATITRLHAASLINDSDKITMLKN